MTSPKPPTHPAGLPCIDPDCRQGSGQITCQRCSARIERARRDYRLRTQKRLFDGPSDQPDHEGTP